MTKFSKFTEMKNFNLKLIRFNVLKMKNKSNLKMLKFDILNFRNIFNKLIRFSLRKSVFHEIRKKSEN